MRKIGLNLLSIGNESYDKCAEYMKQYGFNTTFSGVYEDEAKQAELRETVEKHGITFETLHSPFDGINNIWHDTDDGVCMLNRLKTSVDRCVTAGAPILIVHLSSGLTPPPPTDVGRGRFIELVDHAVKRGVKIAFENQRMLGNIGWAFEEFAKCENVGFCWDCGHEYCFTPGRNYMPLFSDRLICTHIHDNYCQFDVDAHLIPFDGKIPFDFVAKQLKDSGYQGSLMLETFPRYSPPKYNSYQDCDLETFVCRSADAVKKLRDMIDN